MNASFKFQNLWAVALRIACVWAGLALGASAQTPREIFVFAPANLSTKMRGEMAEHLPTLIPKLPPGSAFHLIEMPSRATITTIELKTRLTAASKNQPAFRKAWASLTTFLRKQPDAPAVDSTERTDYIDLPAVWGLLAELRRTQAAPEVVVIGHPLYNDPREKQNSMLPNICFSDNHFLADRSPFGRKLRTITAGSQFILVTVDEKWGYNLKHEDMVERFYRLGCQHRLKGDLQPITPDLSTALTTLINRSYVAQATEELQSATDPVIYKLIVGDVEYVTTPYK